MWLSGEVMESENKQNQKISGSLPSPARATYKKLATLSSSFQRRSYADVAAPTTKSGDTIDEEEEDDVEAESSTEF
jgi:hypothetical protein